MGFRLPPVLRNEFSEIRRAGFELEYTGVGLPQSAEIIINLFGGVHVEENKFFHKVVDTRYGDFTIEIDTAILVDKTYEDYLESLGIDMARLPAVRGAFENMLEMIASAVVPYEIATPPIPITELEAIEKLKNDMRAHKALGTKASLIYAFGLHINCETPKRDKITFLNYLRAFLLLYHWIFVESKIDLARRIAPFIKDFPQDYALSVLDPDYAPTLEQLVEDYLSYNPTRNRPLDMLPLLACIDEKKVRGRVADKEIERGLIKPRPAFHYRLPNCLVDDPDWQISNEWHYWVEIEKLAANPEKIGEMSFEFIELMNSPLKNKEQHWLDKVRRWLK